MLNFKIKNPWAPLAPALKCIKNATSGPTVCLFLRQNCIKMQKKKTKKMHFWLKPKMKNAKKMQVTFSLAGYHPNSKSIMGIF